MNNTIDILTFIKFVLKKSRYVAIGVISGIVAAFLINYFTVETIYKSETKYYLTSTDEVVSYGALQATSTIMDDYLSMIGSRTIVQKAIERNNLNLDEDLVMRMITATNPSKTHLLVVTVKAQDPRQVEDVMEAISYQIVNYIPSIMKGSSLTLFEYPETSVDEGFDKKILNIVVSVIIGVLISIIVLLVRFVSNPTTDDPDAISSEFGDIKTYQIPKIDRRFLIRKKVRQAKLEKELETSINELLYGLVFRNKKSRVILISSPDGKEGKTYVARRLCQTLQQQGIKAALIDSDLKQIEENKINNLNVNEKVSILAMEHRNSLKDKIMHLKDLNEILVIDASPVLQTSEALILAKYCDSIAVVVKYGKTPVNDLKKTIHLFADNKYDVNAIVINQSEV